MQRQEYTTNCFKDYPDYKEGSSNPGKPVYFGSKQSLRKYYDDIDTYGEQSRYLGCVLYPERQGRQDPNSTEKPSWSYLKNMAFWAGIIDQNRPLVLMTNIAFYKRKDEVTGTVAEILWLLDNGYTIKPNTTNSDQMVLVPPAQPLAERKLTDFRTQSVTDTLSRFEKIKADAIKLREQHFGQAQAKISPATREQTFGQAQTRISPATSKFLQSKNNPSPLFKNQPTQKSVKMADNANKPNLKRPLPFNYGNNEENAFKKFRVNNEENTFRRFRDV